MSGTATTAPNGATSEVSKEEEGFRVYVGNLPFSATEEQVREFMAKTGGDILSVLIPTRNKRSAGFAFVHFKTEDAAKKAVSELNETELGERKVQLEIARSKEVQAARREAVIERREAAKAARGEAAAKKEDGEASAGIDGEVKPKKKRSGKKRESRRRLPEEGEEGAAEVNGAISEGAEKPRRKSSTRKPREARIDGEGDGEVERKPRERRERKPKLELTGEESKSTVFVANLPFNVDDDALAAIFTNLSIRVKSAKVVRGLRHGRGGRPFHASRGFGFVEVEDPSQQREAVQKVEGSLIGDRTISAKVANEMKPIEVEEAAEAEKVEADLAT